MFLLKSWHFKASRRLSYWKYICIYWNSRAACLIIRHVFRCRSKMTLNRRLLSVFYKAIKLTNTCHKLTVRRYYYCCCCCCYYYSTLLTVPFSRTVCLSRYQKDETSLDLNEAKDCGVWGCSGICWTICKQSAPPCSRQTTTQTPHHSIFTGRLLFLTPNQQCQSAEGRCEKIILT